MKILIFDHTGNTDLINKAMRKVAGYVPVSMILDWEVREVTPTDVRFINPPVGGHFHVDPQWFKNTFTTQSQGFDFCVAYFTSKQWSKNQKKNKSKAESLNNNFGVSEIALSGSFTKKESKRLAPRKYESQFVTRLLHEMCHGMFDHKLHIKDVTHEYHYNKRNLLEAIALWDSGRTSLVTIESLKLAIKTLADQIAIQVGIKKATETPVSSKIKHLIIHHTGGTDANPLQDSSNYTVQQCNNDHKARFNFISKLGWYVGYQYFIDKAGVVRQCRLDTEEGAHTVGHNSSSIGICLAGNFDATLPTQAQIASLKELLVRKMGEYEIPVEAIVPHRTFANKTCYGKKLPDDWAQKLIS